MTEEMKRVEIGFGGGQVMSSRLEARYLEALREALVSTDKLASEAASWYELESEDGVISLDLRQVVFVRVAAAPHTIGFSGT
ncbi:MAG: hypothetical protein E6G48_01895 [Actinobacteria bacterium]|nr:MAG: hypothetical protein E6G48_01895 [Actinomycetota bacterium]